MSRRIGLALLLLASAFFLLQGAVQVGAGALASANLKRRLIGPVHMEVTAVPFWRLISGDFDRLTLGGTRLQWGRVHIAWARGVWTNGEVHLDQLIGGKDFLQAFAHKGRLALSLGLSPADVRILLPKQGPVRFVRVDIRAPWIYLTGEFAAYGLKLPFTLRGEVTPILQGAALQYRVDGLGSTALRLRTRVSLKVADLRPLGLFPFVRYRRVTTRGGMMVVELTGG